MGGYAGLLPWARLWLPYHHHLIVPLFGHQRVVGCALMLCATVAALLVESELAFDTQQIAGAFIVISLIVFWLIDSRASY